MNRDRHHQTPSPIRLTATNSPPPYHHSLNPCHYYQSHRHTSPAPRIELKSHTHELHIYSVLIASIYLSSHKIIVDTINNYIKMVTSREHCVADIYRGFTMITIFINQTDREKLIKLEKLSKKWKYFIDIERGRPHTPSRSYSNSFM